MRLYVCAVENLPMVMTLNPVVCRDKKKTSPHQDTYGDYISTTPAKVLKQLVDPPPISHPMIDGSMEKMTIDMTMGWTHCPLAEGQKLLVVCHLEPTFAPSYCSAELRLDHIYMLPIDPVVFEWPLTVASASTSATTTPNNTPNKKPKIELRTDF